MTRGKRIKKIYESFDVSSFFSVEDAVKIINLGVEKVAISSSVIENIQICENIGNVIGFQSVVVIIDVKKNIFFNKYDVYIHNGEKKSKWKLKDLLIILNDIGVGEIVINSIDNDGVMKGYDFNLVKLVRNICNLPITILGGAGNLDNIQSLISKYGVIGAAAGSLFVFKGKFKAVLINYPSQKQKIELTKFILK